MNIPATSADQSLLRVQFHCQQWKSFFADQIKLRRALAFKHQQENDKIHLLPKNYLQRAALIKRQMKELLDFRVAAQKISAGLRESQQKEKTVINALFTDQRD
ncbi:hypothetical protein DYBT9623_05479 [Dyadobacter sp. CECT 9623]|uniref:Uncharacterized protein n=1 Tax=Dyadobacter linearis TaxID=2823330 RepID=A0ABN7RJS4_9BACT|nr:hypothetical protein [Dyadobacter sp. CECT 9623]CAG5074791.1 hypothetical protein DYBT9623_05479 [Dyadobacter sp. CECT 9623]